MEITQKILNNTSEYYLFEIKKKDNTIWIEA